MNNMEQQHNKEVFAPVDNNLKPIKRCYSFNLMICSYFLLAKHTTYYDQKRWKYFYKVSTGFSRMKYNTMPLWKFFFVQKCTGHLCHLSTEFECWLLMNITQLKLFCLYSLQMYVSKSNSENKTKHFIQKIIIINVPSCLHIQSKMKAHHIWVLYVPFKYSLQ